MKTREVLDYFLAGDSDTLAQTGKLPEQVTRLALMSQHSMTGHIQRRPVNYNDVLQSTREKENLCNWLHSWFHVHAD